MFTNRYRCVEHIYTRKYNSEYLYPLSNDIWMRLIFNIISLISLTSVCLQNKWPLKMQKCGTSHSFQAIVLPSTVWPKCRLGAKNGVFISTFNVELRNGPYSYEINTGVVLLIFLSDWWVSRFGVVPKLSYRVIRYQWWWYWKFMLIRIFMRLL